ncbi:aminoglycoside phosphotransferase family protein [Brevibacillus invocatus]|uniref:aminoglycoside phosphotransferase family protein n=1 Tax=Brevibacillus invocatus TaxID=173959 RepID=UPI00203B620F|nr:phosphotransferase family protein [Brevibacillus invocatus]MCM3078009.1 phosphotransferase family protein [Brevibacillus invocatus]MCM3427917.1 phosphotransferase family protein [Brevibacillus invocatus]
MSQPFADIPGSNDWDVVKEIKKGWSTDKKYFVQTRNRDQWLLRVSDISLFESKKSEFETVKQINGKNILMSRPIAFGICNNGQSVYALYTWIDGEDAGDVLPALTKKQQYLLGIQSGDYLRSLHQVPSDGNERTWAERYHDKINRYLNNYRSCGIHLEGAERMIDFMEQNRYLLKDRPQTFQHGDYHIGNMLILKSGELGIIDFNRLDYGDPWEEFNRITWCANVSAPFASGRIHGYFDHDVPELFFRLMALYIACNQLSSIHWAIPFGDEEVQQMLKRAEKVLDWYDGFKRDVPSWYLQPDFECDE